MNSIHNKGRYITKVDYDTSGQWYVAGQKRDGTGWHCWWGGTDSDADNKIKNTNDRRVVFGNNDEYYDKEQRWIVLNGRNGYSMSQGINSDLKTRMQRINENNKNIDFIRLFNNNYYFISDSEGSQWSVTSHFSEELKNGGGGPVIDATQANDGSWLVIRPNHFVASNGVSDELTKRLRQFYREHKQRQASRANEIALYDQRILQQEEERQRIEREETERREREAREAKERHEAEKRRLKEERQRKEREEADRREREAREAEERRLKREKEMALKRKSDEVNFLRQINAKRLKLMGQVTAIGFSSAPGDALIRRIIGKESVEVMKPHEPQAGTIIIKDPRLLTTYNSDEDFEVLMMLSYASDKFEAAISLYHCACHNGICRCTKLLSGTFLPDSLLDSNDKKLLTHPPPRLITNDPTIFNEYKCPEKINLRRLQEIVKDLDTDTNKRARRLQCLKQQTLNGKESLELKSLQRCHAFELVARTLAARLHDYPTDENGCVTYEVEYEHRDTSGRGRLFAIGDKVKVDDFMYPRNTTLQGMHSDLRAALVGDFAHDIDCENSEIRLLCSLTKQLGITDLIPTIFDYRDSRSEWLRLISQSHAVSVSDAKRLVNIIISGGRYETWLKSVDENVSESVKKVKAFCFKLYSEVNALLDQLLQHPMFKWTEIEREKLIAKGKSKGAVDKAMMPRIIQCCENEVLGLVHRAFCQNAWEVRAKIFDGLVVEPSPIVHSSTLNTITKKAESTCQALGWDIKLVEKPLNGLQAKRPKTIDDARNAFS